MHECDWMDALVKAADHWAGELREDEEDENALCNLKNSLKAMHYIGEMAQTKLLEHYRETKSIKVG